MKRTRIGTALGLVAATVLAAGLSGPASADGNDRRDDSRDTRDHFKALVFTKTAGFRHDSIPTAVEAITKLGDRYDFSVTATEDAASFTSRNLRRYDVVVFVSTTGDVLDTRQQGAFERYIRNGGGYAGVHAASDTEYDWPWYGGLVGSYFAGHPAQQTATVEVEDDFNASTWFLPQRWVRFDEWYNFRGNPRGEVKVLATLDESTYDAGPSGMGEDHPIAWCHRYEGGRSWYTGMGHTKESYAEPLFLSHLAGGIAQAAGEEPFRCSTQAGPRR